MCPNIWNCVFGWVCVSQTIDGNLKGIHYGFGLVTTKLSGYCGYISSHLLWFEINNLVITAMN